MSAQTEGYLDSIEHLAAGTKLRIERVSWDEYEDLLLLIAGRPGLRVAYDNGRMDIVSPSHEHEGYKELIGRLMQVLDEETATQIDFAGGTTFRRRSLLKGAEPDGSFYLQNGDAIVGKNQIDLETDPPPDIVVEIDIASESKTKFPIYAAFGVPEIWHFDGQQARMYRLSDTEYVEIQESVAFPFLNAEALAHFLRQSRTQRQSATVAAFRGWVRKHKSA